MIMVNRSEQYQVLIEHYDNVVQGGMIRWVLANCPANTVHNLTTSRGWWLAFDDKMDAVSFKMEFG